MAERENTGILKLALMVYAVIVFLYGAGYLFIPDVIVEMSGGAPVFDGWLRWSGAVLVALGVGALLTYKNPRGQGIFVTVLTVGCLLCSICMFWAIVSPGQTGHKWFPAAPGVILLMLTILFLVGRAKAKDILYIR